MANGLNSVNGLAAGAGLMTSDAGRKTVSYLVRCALAAGDTLVKQDHNGNNYTYAGQIGLAPQYKTGGCNKDCTEELSSCLMAHINTTGVHIPLWLDSPMASIGWGQSPFYPTQEGTFFGQIFVTNSTNKLDAYYCNGANVASNEVPGRLGGAQSGVPYANAYPTSGGLCATSGHCAMQSNSDGAVSCVGNGTTWTHPITVWRGQTFQAENTTLSGKAAPIACANCGGGYRVGYIGMTTTSTVTLKNVNVAQGGINNLIVYYVDGDPSTWAPRAFNISVNGGAQQYTTFTPTGGGWNDNASLLVGSVNVSLTGFNAGSNNTITFAAASGTGVGVPDLDWVEVMPSAQNYCNSSNWTATASNSYNTGGASIGPDGAFDGNLATRWSTGLMQNGGSDWYQVDFGGDVSIGNITLNNADFTTDYPAQYAVYGSSDGATFDSSPFVTGNGASGSTVINFPKRTVRAVKVVQSGTSNSTHWWGIGEFQTSSCSSM